MSAGEIMGGTRKMRYLPDACLPMTTNDFAKGPAALDLPSTTPHSFAP